MLRFTLVSIYEVRRFVEPAKTRKNKRPVINKNDLKANAKYDQASGAGLKDERQTPLYDHNQVEDSDYTPHDHVSSHPETHQPSDPQIASELSSCRSG